ncbi:hypothetical protein PAHAL_1G044400 [Panicum hallii]|uniref:Uncharacterized protein n=1 Tax=Panicum hallii TaxID=206008 RepID=A0A2S3GLJ4_9POAL|nr:hypothetical protein PAHAL_1G044400 [Panicum hallii]
MEPTASVPVPRSISRQRAQPLSLAYATDGMQQREMLAADPAGHLQRHRRLARCEVGSAGRGAWRRRRSGPRRNGRGREIRRALGTSGGPGEERKPVTDVQARPPSPEPGGKGSYWEAGLQEGLFCK